MEEISRLIDTLGTLVPRRCVIFGGVISKQVLDVNRAESALIESAVIKRQREFACGRYYIHQVLQSFGHDVPVIDRDKAGCPQWPEGIVGSISHTSNYCIAAAGATAGIASIGIDLEESERLKSDLWPRLFIPHEIERLNYINDPIEQRRQAAIMFSAKESFYKCDFPLNKKYIGFTEIEIRLEGNHGLKFIHVETNAVVQYHGFYCSGSTHVLTAVIKAADIRAVAGKQAVCA